MWGGVLISVYGIRGISFKPLESSRDTSPGEVLRHRFSMQAEKAQVYGVLGLYSHMDERHRKLHVVEGHFGILGNVARECNSTSRRNCRWRSRHDPPDLTHYAVSSRAASPVSD